MPCKEGEEATFIMTLRAARAADWGVLEVDTACRQQLANLAAYRASVDIDTGFSSKP
jgi:hypothetical protein